MAYMGKPSLLSLDMIEGDRLTLSESCEISDFLNGWDIDVLQQATNECTSAAGVIDE